MSIAEPLDQPAGWWLTVYPTAGEASGTFVYQGRLKNRNGSRTAPNPERARSEAARRARARLRRYCASNRLNRLGTLTYGPPFCTDPRQARTDVGVFFRKLRRAMGVECFPYAWVPEFHADGERLHLHFAVGRFVQRSLIEQAWPHGFVHIKLLSDLPVGSGPVEEGRRTAAYLAKYVTKSFDEPKLLGLHRFDVAQGFQPHGERVYGCTASEGVRQAGLFFDGLSPSYLWRSSEVEGWQGPPAVFAAWAR